MRRFSIAPRKDWQKKVEELGFIWHTAKGVPYWNESAYYSFTMKQIEEIEAATEELHGMFVKAAQHVIDNNLFSQFDIPESFVPRIIEDWNRETPALNYGRFDFGYDGVNPPKLFEYNADTPTSLVEASVIQWLWKEEQKPSADQFNSLHEKFVARWKEILPHVYDHVHFTNGEEPSGEDLITTTYLMDTLKEAGGNPLYVPLELIGWDNLVENFVDHEDRDITTLYKLYPWEWLVNEDFAENILKAGDETLFIEPSWKMLFSNKAILPILWELNKGHPNLLWAGNHPPVFGSEVWESYVTKPILAREGANVTLFKDGVPVTNSDGVYKCSRNIFQQGFSLPNYAGRYPVIGSWCIDGQAAGMGIREDGLITGNTASFIPHIIEG
jgi:glutathionylspermidine synthase